MIKGRIYLNEKVVNQERKFGSCSEYYPVVVVDDNGNERAGLLTDNDIKGITDRAARNPEDIPEKTSFWDFLGLSW